jgi:ribosomal protein S27E
MNDDDGDEPRFHATCPQCGDTMNGGVIGGGDVPMLLSVSCLICGYSALVDPYA